MPLTIRAARVDDAAAIEAVHYASRDAVFRGTIPDWADYGPGRPERIARWEDWLTDPRIVSLVGEVNGDMVGFVTVRPSTDEGENPSEVAEMPTLYVHPDHWRRGYGSALCAAALDAARGLGHSELTLWVVELNTQAQAFYAKYGFVEDGATKVDEGTRELNVKARRFRIPFAV